MDWIGTMELALVMELDMELDLELVSPSLAKVISLLYFTFSSLLSSLRGLLRHRFEVLDPL